MILLTRTGLFAEWQVPPCRI